MLVCDGPGAGAGAAADDANVFFASRAERKEAKVLGWDVWVTGEGTSTRTGEGSRDALSGSTSVSVAVGEVNSLCSMALLVSATFCRTSAPLTVENFNLPLA